MRAAGHRVLVNALGRREVATDKVVTLVSRRSHDDTVAIQARDRREIRAQVTHGLRTFQQDQVVEFVGNNLNGNDTQCRACSSAGSLNVVRKPRRKIHGISRGRAIHRQRSAGRVENHAAYAQVPVAP